MNRLSDLWRIISLFATIFDLALIINVIDPIGVYVHWIINLFLQEFFCNLFFQNCS
jgi:hypothetical protein